MAQLKNNYVENISKKIENFGEYVGTIASYFVLVIIAITVLEVVMRYFFNSPTIWVHETSEIIFAVMFLIGGSYAVIHDGHVRVDAIYNHLPDKAKLFSEILTFIFLMLYLSVLTYQGTDMAIESIRQLERSQTPWGPYIFPVIALVPIASFLMILQGIVKFISIISNFSKD